MGVGVGRGQGGEGRLQTVGERVCSHLVGFLLSGGMSRQAKATGVCWYVKPTATPPVGLRTWI